MMISEDNGVAEMLEKQGKENAAAGKESEQEASETDDEPVTMEPGYLVLATLTFIFLLPLSLFSFSQRVLITDLVGLELSSALYPVWYLIQQLIVFQLLWGAFRLIGHYQEIIPGLGPDRMTKIVQRISRATGQRGRDSRLSILSIVLLCFCLIAVLAGRIEFMQHLPLFIISTQTFIVLFAKANKEPWPIKKPSALIPCSPDDIPPIPARGKTIVLEWSFPRLSSEFTQESCVLRILEEQYLKCKASGISSEIPESQLSSAIEELSKSECSKIYLTLAGEVQKLASGLALSYYEVLGCCHALAKSISIEENQHAVTSKLLKTPVELLYENLGTTIDRGYMIFSLLRAMFPQKPGMGLELWINTHKRLALVAAGDKDLPLPDDFYRDSGIVFYMIDPSPEGNVGKLPRGVDPSSYVKIKA